MSKTYLPYDPDQQLLLPAALQEWLPPGPPGLLHLRRGGPVGPLGYHGPLRRGKAGRAALPSQDDGQSAALRLLHRCGILASHRPALHEDIAFRVLAANNTPTSAPYLTSARTIWRRWRTCSCRCWSCASRQGW